MIFAIAAILGVIALFFLLVLVGIVLVGWFGLNDKVKKFVNSYLSRSFDQNFRNVDQVPINTQCYICLQRINHPVVTTCNHSYCANCIISYIESNGGRNVNCPACRQKICVLFRQFQPRTEQQRSIKNKIADFNFKNSQQPGIIRSLTELPNIIRNAPTLISPDGIRFLMTNPRVKVILVLLIYTFSPIDILPEAFLGPFGFLDDSFAILNIFREVSGLMIDYAQDQQRRNRVRNEQREMRERRIA